MSILRKFKNRLQGKQAPKRFFGLATPIDGAIGATKLFVHRLWADCTSGTADSLANLISYNA
jgi:hypothetical protein